MPRDLLWLPDANPADYSDGGPTLSVVYFSVA
jgi:hypothetical protein